MGKVLAAQVWTLGFRFPEQDNAGHRNAHTEFQHCYREMGGGDRRIRGIVRAVSVVYAGANKRPQGQTRDLKSNKVEGDDRHLRLSPDFHTPPLSLYPSCMYTHTYFTSSYTHAHTHNTHTHALAHTHTIGFVFLLF